MKKSTVAYALGALVCTGTWVSLPRAVAEDPPLLEPPALTTPDPGRGAAADPLTAIRRDGPPRESPEDPAGPAPGPDFFYIAGQYVPAGNGVAWRPGFWSRNQPGWEWVPARWVRQSEGWVYREGHWSRDESPSAAPDAPRRHVVARPAPFSTSPFAPDAMPPTEGQVDPGTVTGLAPLPDAGSSAPLLGVQPAPGAGSSPPPAAGLPDPNGNAVPNPNLEPRRMGPIVPFVPPITEINVPGVHIRIFPPVLWGSGGPLGYPGVVVPPVQVRVARPLAGVRQRVRDLIDGTLP